MVLLGGVLALAIGAFVGLDGSSAHHHPRAGRATVRLPAGAAGAPTAATAGAPASSTAVSAPPPPPRPLVVSAPSGVGSSWRTVALVHGQPAAWLAERGGVMLMRFDQRYLRLDLHPGAQDGGSEGFLYGDEVTSREIHHLVAGFNGGFRLSYSGVGFVEGERVAAPLKDGLASIVTYADGTTAIGSWHEGVPAPDKPVFSVLQNQHLLVDRGVPAASAAACITECWGATIEGRTVVARSGLGITASGELVWAGGEELLPDSLAHALVAAGAVRAVELDINPDWVAGYLYPHRASGPVAVPVVPGQIGINGQLLAPDSRDFLTVVANR